VWDDFGDARWDALLAMLVYDRRPHRLSVAWTLGRAQSEFGEFTTSGYASARDYRMQRSEGDERHRVVVSGITRLPYGVELSGIGIVASPHPFLVTAGIDANRNGNRADDWPGGSRTLRRRGWEHWYRTVDLRLTRAFPLARGRTTVMAEVFNAFNTANHAEYRAVQASVDYGQPVGDYARRQVQLGLRHRF
jgi:hypothetical protein